MIRKYEYVNKTIIQIVHSSMSSQTTSSQNIEHIPSSYCSLLLLAIIDLTLELPLPGPLCSGD